MMTTAEKSKLQLYPLSLITNFKFNIWAFSHKPTAMRRVQTQTSNMYPVTYIYQNM